MTKKKVAKNPAYRLSDQLGGLEAQRYVGELLGYDDGVVPVDTWTSWRTRKMFACFRRVQYRGRTLSGQTAFLFTVAELDSLVDEYFAVTPEETT